MHHQKKPIKICRSSIAREVLCHTTPQKEYRQMQNSDIPYLYLNTCFLTILHSLTLQNTITSLTKTIFRGAHIHNSPSFLPYFHHSSYTILTILFYSHIKFRPHLAIYIKKNKMYSGMVRPRGFVFVYKSCPPSWGVCVCI